MSDIDEILDLYRQEASEHLAAIEKGFLNLEIEESVEKRGLIIDSLFRHAHGLKGAARAVELNDVQACAQKLENTLDELRENPEMVTIESIEQGLAQFDQLQKAADQWQKGSESPTESPIENQKTKTENPEDTFTVRVGSDRLDRMLSFAGELRISQRAADLHAQQLRELSSAELRSAIEVGQIGKWQAAVENLLAEMHQRQVREEMLLKSLEGDIQDARLLPLSMLAESLRRAVRDLGQSLGKTIQYQIDVGTVLLDKAVIEALKDPLLHMIRNAAHHGLETPQERQIAGKPEEGRILLRAQRRGDRVNIYVCDDGRGVNFDRIRQRVRQTSGLEETEVAGLDQRELAAYLFHAGFTTVEKADEISGRGVGLDVAFDTLLRLQGSVELESSSPSGTTFIIDVPTTISTVRILTVACAGQFYGIPSSSIVRTARVHPDELRELKGSLILTVDEEPVPWVMLSDLVGAQPGASAGNGRAMPYVLTSHEGKRLAIGVDDTEDELEVILKPLGFPLNGMAGILGGTIRPNGSVQIVLDPNATTFRPQRRRAAVKPQKAAARILVVDDSPTTRAIVRGVLTAAGYAVRTASDGVDALERMRSYPIDLVVSDVQMPRMNGFELARQVKSQFGLPIVLVTGLEKEEHRREGLAAGADAYVVKSTFEGKGLLEIVRQFV